MAIDNLYFKCSEGSQRIKHKFEEYIEANNEKKGSKKKDDSKKPQKKEEDNNDGEESTYEEKARIASLKLKCIFNYMKDFKTIID
jgi:hypothetical protein